LGASAFDLIDLLGCVGTERKLLELMQRDLSGLELVALMIDGVHFADHVVLAAVGIDCSGEKHPLGLREGATEALFRAPSGLVGAAERGSRDRNPATGTGMVTPCSRRTMRNPPPRLTPASATTADNQSPSHAHTGAARVICFVCEVSIGMPPN
jgi:hypothetical protein